MREEVRRLRGKEGGSHDMLQGKEEEKEVPDKDAKPEWNMIEKLNHNKKGQVNGGQPNKYTL